MQIAKQWDVTIKKIKGNIAMALVKRKNTNKASSHFVTDVNGDTILVWSF